MKPHCTYTMVGSGQGTLAPTHSVCNHATKSKPSVNFALWGILMMCQRRFMGCDKSAPLWKLSVPPTQFFCELRTALKYNFWALAQAVGSSPSQGTYKNQPMNASVSGTANRSLSLPLSLSFSKINKKIKYNFYNTHTLTHIHTALFYREN